MRFKTANLCTQYRRPQKIRKVQKLPDGFSYFGVRAAKPLRVKQGPGEGLFKN
jgi:hypothetical protein